MKIGIITVHRAHNSGAMLQALALQETLRRMRHSPCMVEANTIGEGRRWPSVSLRTWKGWVVCTLQIVLSAGIRARKLRLFRRFLRHFTLSARFNRASDIREADFDLFIVGSDQVWNLEIVKDAQLFLLEFCGDGAKKAAYAASFGIEALPPAWTERFRIALASFSGITVREETAARIVAGLTGITPPVVLDPTLLLTAADYRSFEAPRIVRRPYVCVYSIGAAAAYMRELGRRIAAARGLKLVFVDATSFGDWRRSFRDYQIVSPDRFLSFLCHAECVICTSYHATIFSIQYEKPFLTVLPKGSRVTSRPRSLLNRLELKDHLVDEDADLNDLATRIDVDYERVRPRIQSLRKASLDELRRMIGESPGRPRPDDSAQCYRNGHARNPITSDEVGGPL